MGVNNIGKPEEEVVGRMRDGGAKREKKGKEMNKFEGDFRTYLPWAHTRHTYVASHQPIVMLSQSIPYAHAYTISLS